jgi:hypothetical protein
MAIQAFSGECLTTLWAQTFAIQAILTDVLFGLKMLEPPNRCGPKLVGH